MITIEHPWLLAIGISVIIGSVIWRLWQYQYPRYYFPFAHLLRSRAEVEVNNLSPRVIQLILRSICLTALVCAVARVRMPDERSRIPVEGNDIVLTLDVSGSMQLFDDVQDPRTRFTVMQQEALRFIDKRIDDPIGVVMFATCAVSRCPITLDKDLLHQLIADTQLGDINPKGTVIGQALMLALKRLQHAPSKNKMIILLTDGSPSPHDISVDPALTLAKKWGIKIYTVAIGAEDGGYLRDPLFGLQQVPDSINVRLLQHIAYETGGACFRAQSPHDMRKIYDTIDTLEKTEHDAPLYNQYYEFFILFLWIALCALVGECGYAAWQRMLV